MACRMFGYCGDSEADVRELHSGLQRACANDPMLDAVAAGCSRHCHGWGYVVHAENGLFHYRTAKPVYDDKVELPRLEGKIRAIFHGRYASKPELAGPIFAHPFVAADDLGVTFLAHNGGVEPENLPERKVDSEWVLEELARGGNTASVLTQLKARTKSALNLLVLRIGREVGTPAELKFFHYFKPKEPAKAKYYQMYVGTMPHGRALVSSTFATEGAQVNGLGDLAPAPFDVFSTLES